MEIQSYCVFYKSHLSLLLVDSLTNFYGRQNYKDDKWSVPLYQVQRTPNYPIYVHICTLMVVSYYIVATTALGQPITYRITPYLFCWICPPWKYKSQKLLVPLRKSVAEIHNETISLWKVNTVIFNKFEYVLVWQIRRSFWKCQPLSR